MKRRLRQNATDVSEIYIGRPIYIQYPTRLGQGLGLGLELGLWLGLGLGQGYRTSDIDIGRPIYILDVQYIYWMSDIYQMSDIDFGKIGDILS